MCAYNAYNTGDVIRVGGVRPDGTTDPKGTSRPDDKLWRVGVIMPDGRVRLHPLHPDGTLDEFNDGAGEFWLVPEVKSS